MTTRLYGRNDLRGCCRLDIDDLRLLWLFRSSGCNELVASVREASTSPTVAGRDDEQRQTDDGADDGTGDRACVGFAAIITTTYFFTSHCV